MLKKNGYKTSTKNGKIQTGCTEVAKEGGVGLLAGEKKNTPTHHQAASDPL